MPKPKKYWSVSYPGILLLGSLIMLPLHATESEFKVGKTIYKKANCIGCHKWHGKGGGGYGGVALSLRDSQLDKENLALVIRCGRPGTGMPYHHRKAYRGDDRSCYDSTGQELGDAKPPRARYFLKDTDIEHVVIYVMNQMQGRGEPGHSDCVAFWGADAKRCQMMAK